MRRSVGQAEARWSIQQFIELAYLPQEHGAACGSAWSPEAQDFMAKLARRHPETLAPFCQILNDPVSILDARKIQDYAAPPDLEQVSAEEFREMGLHARDLPLRGRVPSIESQHLSLQTAFIQQNFDISRNLAAPSVS
jgi:hypothetical protein